MFLNSEILSPKLLRLYKNSDKFQMEVRLYKNNSSVYTKLYAFIWQCMQWFYNREWLWICMEINIYWCRFSLRHHRSCISAVLPFELACLLIAAERPGRIMPFHKRCLFLRICQSALQGAAILYESASLQGKVLVVGLLWAILHSL